MNILDSIREELKRSPVTTVSGVVAASVATLGLFLAWTRTPSESFAAVEVGSTAAQKDSSLDLENLFLFMSFFLASTVAVALMLKLIARKREFVALIGSVPIVALSNFLSILVLYLAPPRQLTAQLFTSAHDLVTYGSAVIVVAFCGGAVLREIVSSKGRDSPDTKRETGAPQVDGIGILVICILLVIFWGWLVSAGQARLTITLLPDITHPIDMEHTN